MSLDVDVLILKTNNHEIRKCIYFTALDKCDQDTVDNLCITDHVLCEMRKIFLIFKRYTRNQIMLIAMLRIQLLKLNIPYVKNMI